MWERRRVLLFEVEGEFDLNQQCACSSKTKKRKKKRELHLAVKSKNKYVYTHVMTLHWPLAQKKRRLIKRDTHINAYEQKSTW